MGFSVENIGPCGPIFVDNFNLKGSLILGLRPNIMCNIMGLRPIIYATLKGPVGPLVDRFYQTKNSRQAMILQGEMKVIGLR